MKVIDDVGEGRLNEWLDLVLDENFILQRVDSGAGFIIGWEICQELSENIFK